MSSCRRIVGVLVVLAVALLFSPAPSRGLAGSLDACAQPVIRDWYSGGRVDDVYPLACYRAALGALPADVLQYSNADQDIRRALAFARQGRKDPGNGPAADPTEPSAPPPAAPAERSRAPEPGERPKTTTAPPPHPDAGTAAPRDPRDVVATPSRSSVPYPIVALAALSAVLLATGAVGWLRHRRG